MGPFPPIWTFRLQQRLTMHIGHIVSLLDLIRLLQHYMKLWPSDAGKAQYECFEGQLRFS